MIIFWVLAGLMVAFALWFALRPLFRGGSRAHPAAEKLAMIGNFEQQLNELDADLTNGTLAPETYEQRRMELEKRLLKETAGGSATPAPSASRGARRFVVPVAIGLLAPLLAVGVYFLAGKPQVVDTKAPAAESANGAAHPTTPEQVQAMVARLAARLEKNPQDADGWAMLGRSYTMLRRFDDGVAAFAKAAALQPGDAQLLADYADTAAMAQGKRFDGKPSELIERALKVDPNNMKALALAGSAAFDAGAYAQAVAFWQQLLQHVPPESEIAGTLTAQIADARQRGALKAPSPVAEAGAGKSVQATAGRDESAAVHAGATVKGRVRLIAELADKASPTDTVFVIARAVDGPPMPLAVLKRQVKDLPLDFTLDDTMALSPETKLSQFKEVDVAARISKSGNATTQKGDLLSQPVRTLVGGPEVELPIRGMMR